MNPYQQNFKKCQQNDIDLSISMFSLETPDLEKLKNFIIQFNNISNLKIVFSYIEKYNQVGLNQLISLLSRIQIQQQLKILVRFQFQWDFDVIKFAFEISKNSSIQSFKLEFNCQYTVIQTFKIKPNNENGQNFVSQLEYMKNNGKYSTLEDLYQISQNIFLRKLYLNQFRDQISFKNETKSLSNFYYLKYLKYRIKMDQDEYDQILSLNQVLSSIQNLQKLDLNIEFQQKKFYPGDYETNDNLLIEEKHNNEKDQKKQIEYFKIKEIAKLCKNIQYVNLKMEEHYSDVKIKSPFNFKISLFKIIFWSIQNTQDLNINIPNWLMGQFANEISLFQQLETLTFEIDSNFLNEDNSHKLGISLNQCKNLKKLQMNISIKTIKENQNISIISNHLKQLSCQKNIIIKANYYQLTNNKYSDKTQVNAQILNQIKEILGLDNIYSLKFIFNFRFQEIITLLKNPISNLSSLQTIHFIEYKFEKKTPRKYINWESQKQLDLLISCSDQIYEKFENQFLIKSIRNNNYLKKIKRLVNINLFHQSNYY